MITEAIKSTEALALAIGEFNAAFNMDLRLPVWPRDVESAAVIAELRGQPALAGKLRSTIDSH